ncbi:hypothetical protein BDW69DRAFT_184147 [Aspergillus filifer]
MPYPNQSQAQNQPQPQPQPHRRSEITYPRLPQATNNNDPVHSESNPEIPYPLLTHPIPNPPTHDPSLTPIPNLPHPNPYWPTHDPATISTTLTPIDKTYGIAVDREDNIYFTTGRLCKLISFPYFIRVDLPLGSRADVGNVQAVSFAEFEAKANEMVRVQVTGDVPPAMPTIGEVSWGYSWDLERGEVLRGVGSVTGVGLICLAVVLDEDDERYSESSNVGFSHPEDEESEDEDEEEDSGEEGEAREDYFPDQKGDIWARDPYFGFKPSLGFR